MCFLQVSCSENAVWGQATAAGAPSAATAAYGQMQVSVRGALPPGPRPCATGGIPTCGVNNSRSSTWRATGQPGACLQPAFEDGGKLGQVVDRRVRVEVDPFLGRTGERPTPHRAESQTLRSPDVLTEPVSHHDRLFWLASGELEG